jgi:hypothetical protein
MTTYEKLMSIDAPTLIFLSENDFVKYNLSKWLEIYEYYLEEQTKVNEMMQLYVNVADHFGVSDSMVKNIVTKFKKEVN